VKFPVSQLEGVFSIPFPSTEVSVVMTNTTDKPLTIDGQTVFAGLSANFPLALVLGSHQSKVLKLPADFIRHAKAGAVSLSHNGEKGALLAMIYAQEEDRGFSLAVNFSTKRGLTNQIQGAGLRLDKINGRNLKPVIVVRNLSKETRIITAKIPYTGLDGSEGSIAIPQLTLDSGKISLLDTSNFKLLRSEFATAGLEIEYTGTPGEVIASAYSMSADGDQVFALPLKDPQAILNSTGSYPWFIDEKGSTVVFIKNTTNEPQRFLADIVYPGGMWGSNLRTIAPGQTVMLDVKAIRDAQVKGSEGNTVPIDATVGHVYWTSYGASAKKLIGRSQTVNLGKRLAVTYECQMGCSCGAGGFYNGRITPSSASVDLGDTAPFVAEQQDVNCMYIPGSWYTVSASWASSDTNIATVSGGIATGTGAGSTSIMASWMTSFTTYGDTGDCTDVNPCHCTTNDSPFDTSAVVTVQCRIPTGETQAGVGWETVGQYLWRQTLQPATVNWAGRRFREVSYQAGTDGCHFQNSSIDEQPRFLPTTIFTLENNQYNDEVGWTSADAVNYYRVERPLRGLPLPCEADDFQEMEMFCGDVPTPWVSNVLRSVITATDVQSWRGNQGAGRTWP
jgi:hypothetical protein